MEQQLQLLIETLEKKKAVLARLIILNEEQTEILAADKFDLDTFNANTDAKAEQIEQLEKLDHGFDATFNRIREELLANQKQYAVQIKQMQKLIQETVDQGASVYTGEHRNKQMVERQFQMKRAEIKAGRSGSKAAYDYYRTMNKSKYIDSMYLDQKK